MGMHMLKEADTKHFHLLENNYATSENPHIAEKRTKLLF